MAKTKYKKSTRRRTFVPRSFVRARPAIAKAATMLVETATPIIKSKLEEKVATMDIDGVVKAVQSAAEQIKPPKGESGKNLNKDKNELLEQTAVGGTTESNCCFSYRPNKPTKTSDTISYTAIRNKKVTLTNNAGSQASGDRNLALLVPPKNDDMDSNTSYCNFDIKNEFDRMLRARMNVDYPSAGTEVIGKKETLIAHFHSLSSIMILKAPSSGAIVEIYDLQPRFAIGPSNYYSETYGSGYLSPLWCWVSGLSNNVVIETNDDYGQGTVGSDPLDSPTFRRCWNIVKKTTCRMTANSIHRHRMAWNINKSVNYYEMAQAGSDGGTVPWLPTQMVVTRGYPTNDSLAESVSVEIQQESKLSYSSRLAQTTNVIVYNNNT